MRGSGAGGEALSFSFDWRRKEHAAVLTYLQAQRSRRGSGRVVRWALYAVFPVAALVVVLAALTGDFESAGLILALLAAATLLMIFSPRLLGWIGAWRTARLDPAVDAPITYSLDDRGLKVSAKDSSFEITWEGVHKVEETDDLLLFYYHPLMAYYLPKRVVDPDGLNAVRRLVRDRHESSPRPRSTER